MEAFVEIELEPQSSGFSSDCRFVFSDFFITHSVRECDQCAIGEEHRLCDADQHGLPVDKWKFGLFARCERGQMTNSDASEFPTGHEVHEGIAA